MLSVSSSSCSGCSMWARSMRVLHLAVGDAAACAGCVDVAHFHHPGTSRSLCVKRTGSPPDREVAALRVALVVLGHEDPAQVGVAVEDHAEHVVDLALLVVGGRPRRRVTRRHVRRVGAARASLTVMRSTVVHVQQLVVHAEARLLGEVVDAVHGGEEAEALAAQVLEHGAARSPGVDRAAPPCSRKKIVSSTASPSRSRSSCAISSRPVASGTRPVLPLPETLITVTSSSSDDELLGAAAAVARAPALVGLATGPSARSLRMPWTSASGRGGQPGTCTSTGMNLSAGTIA